MPAETKSSSGPSDIGENAGRLAAEGRRYRFGVFEVDLPANEIRKQGLKIKLQDKPFQLLVLLLERAGGIATREELRHGLWPADTFVDFDANLKTALNKLRHALGDSADSPIFIETVPRHGYRFLPAVVDVTQEPTVPGLDVRPKDPASPALSAAPAKISRLLIWRLVSLGLALVAITLAAFWLRPRSSRLPVPAAGHVVLLVLPFDNLTGDPAQEYFSDGLTDEMITEVGQQSSPGLAVIARTSAMRYKGTHKTVDQIARELGSVQYVLEGSVRRAGDRVGINVHLMRTQDQTNLWSETYETNVADTLTVQRDVTGRIARSLVLQLAPPPTAPAAIDPKAYDAYLMARFEANKRTKDGLAKSFQYYEQAIALHPSYSAAYAGLADSYLLSAGWLMLKPTEAYPKAKAAALRALDLNPSLAEAHTTLAEVEHEYEWQWAEAEKEFRRAIELNPNSAIAHKSYAEFLMHAGRNNEAIAEIERARDLDPLSLIVNSLVGFVYFNAGNYDRAAAECAKVVQLDPQFAPAHYFLGAALLQQKRNDEAIVQFKIARSLSDASLMAAGVARAYAAAGHRAQALQVLQELQRHSSRAYVSPYGLAQVYSSLGDKDHAIELLQRAGSEHSFELVFLNIDRSFDGLRDDPRFQDLVKRIGFPSRSGGSRSPASFRNLSSLQSI